MRPDCQLRAFNAEVTGSPTTVLSPCSHSCPPTLVPLFGDDGEGGSGWRTALSSQGTSTPRTWCSSVISLSSFGPSLVILGRFPPRLGPWAYHSKWAGVPRSFGPTSSISKIKPIRIRLLISKSYSKRNFSLTLPLKIFRFHLKQFYKYPLLNNQII